MAHGSRNAEANRDLYHFAERLQSEKWAAQVEPGFLELVEPDILTAASRCVRPGITEIVMLPFFLSAGVHVRQDLAQIRDQLQSKQREIRYLLAEPLGRHPLLLAALEDRLQEALSQPTSRDSS